MEITFPAQISNDSLFVWLMHRIAGEFREHAILKGGMTLRLLNCPRRTNDLDYVFVPYRSKKDIEKGLNKIISEIKGAKINKTMNSKTIRITIQFDNASVQVEAGVSSECKAIAMSTNSLAREVNEMGRVIRIMSFDVALSHKLAAWNERRLLRDLYDIYFIHQVIGEDPDMGVLSLRLNKIESRIPSMRKIKKMSISDFADELEKAAKELSEISIIRELSPFIDNIELAGLDKKIKVALNKIVGILREDHTAV